MRSTPGHVSILLVAVCTAAFSAPAQPAPDPLELRTALLRATVTAIDLEIVAYRERLATAEGGTGPKENVERFRKRLEALDAERQTASLMSPEDYPLPTGDEPEAIPILDPAIPYGPMLPPLRCTVTGSVDAPCQDGTLLSVEGATRSGPFYHLAGISGGDYGLLRPGKRYELGAYLVYRREYFGEIGDYYIYVAGAR